MKRSRSFWDTLIVIGIVTWFLLTPLCIGIYLDVRQGRNEEFLDTVRSADAKEVDAALRAGADPNAHDIPESSFHDGWEGMWEFTFRTRRPNTKRLRTALSYACENRNAGAVIPLLLDRGASIPEAQTCEPPALSTAVEKGNEAAVRILLEHGADVNERSDIGLSLLQSAIGSDNPRLVRLLLDHKASLGGAAIGGDPHAPNYATIVRMIQDAGKP